MRSTTPIPGNPWPHDMVIRVEDTSQALLELLWVREARGLSPVGDDLPPLLVDPPRNRDEVDAGERAGWEAAWPDLWAAVVDHAAAPVDHTLFERMNGTAPGSAERMALIRRIHGPSWHDRFGEDGLGDAFRGWHADLVHARAGRSRSLQTQPERVCLAALVPAWEAGLTTVIVIPCQGEHTRRVGAHALLVTDTTRDDPPRYAAALASFPGA